MWICPENSLFFFCQNTMSLYIFGLTEKKDFVLYVKKMILKISIFQKLKQKIISIYLN